MINEKSNSLEKKEDIMDDTININNIALERRNAKFSGNVPKVDFADMTLPEQIISYINTLSINRESMNQDLEKHKLRTRSLLKKEIKQKYNLPIIENVMTDFKWKLMVLLKKLHGFKQFLSFNGIDDESLKLVIIFNL